jgi:hypothetical protein
MDEVKLVEDGGGGIGAEYRGYPDVVVGVSHAEALVGEGAKDGDDRARGWGIGIIHYRII